jgi:hypothetical protein
MMGFWSIGAMLASAGDILKERAKRAEALRVGGKNA